MNLTEGKQAKEGGGGDGSRKGGDGEVAATKKLFSFLLTFIYFIFKGKTVRLLINNLYCKFSFYI